MFFHFFDKVKMTVVECCIVCATLSGPGVMLIVLLFHSSRVQVEHTHTHTLDGLTNYGHQSESIWWAAWHKIEHHGYLTSPLVWWSSISLPLFLSFVPIKSVMLQVIQYFHVFSLISLQFVSMIEWISTHIVEQMDNDETYCDHEIVSQQCTLLRLMFSSLENLTNWGCMSSTRITCSKRRTQTLTFSLLLHGLTILPCVL